MLGVGSAKSNENSNDCSERDPRILVRYLHEKMFGQLLILPWVNYYSTIWVSLLEFKCLKMRAHPQTQFLDTVLSYTIIQSSHELFALFFITNLSRMQYFVILVSLIATRVQYYINNLFGMPN